MNRWKWKKLIYYSNVTQILELLLSYMPKVSDLTSKIILIIYWLTIQLGPSAIQLKQRTVKHLTCKWIYYPVIRAIPPVNTTKFSLTILGGGADGELGEVGILKALSLYTSEKSSYNPRECSLKSTIQQHDDNLYYFYICSLLLKVYQ